MRASTSCWTTRAGRVRLCREASSILCSTPYGLRGLSRESRAADLHWLELFFFVFFCFLVWCQDSGIERLSFGTDCGVSRQYYTLAVLWFHYYFPAGFFEVVRRIMLYSGPSTT